MKYLYESLNDLLTQINIKIYMIRMDNLPAKAKFIVGLTDQIIENTNYIRTDSTDAALRGLQHILDNYEATRGQDYGIETERTIIYIRVRE